MHYPKPDIALHDSFQNPMGRQQAYLDFAEA